MEFFLLSVGVLLAQAGIGQSATQEFTAEQKQLIVDLHNQARSETDPAPLDAMQMEWDDSLAAYALEWAACGNMGRHRQWAGENYLRAGENLVFGGMGSNWDATATITGGFGAWMAEGDYYDYETTTCDIAAAPSGTCYHYTQIIWSTTSKIGCAFVTACNANAWKQHDSTPTGPHYDNGFMMICEYSKHGNCMVEQNHPYSSQNHVGGSQLCDPYPETTDCASIPSPGDRAPEIVHVERNDDKVVMRIKMGCCANAVCTAHKIKYGTSCSSLTNKSSASSGRQLSYGWAQDTISAVAIGIKGFFEKRATSTCIDFDVTYYGRP